CRVRRRSSRTPSARISYEVPSRLSRDATSTAHREGAKDAKGREGFFPKKALLREPSRTSRLRGVLLLLRSGACAGHFAEGADEDLAGFGAVGRADDAVALHPLDHPGGAVVADAQLALEERDGDEAHVGERGDGLVVELVGSF